MPAGRPALTVNSELTAFKPGDKEYIELARFKVADTETWAHPVADGNRVFVRDRESVASGRLSKPAVRHPWRSALLSVLVHPCTPLCIWD